MTSTGSCLCSISKQAIYGLPAPPDGPIHSVIISPSVTTMIAPPQSCRATGGVP